MLVTVLYSRTLNAVDNLKNETFQYRNVLNHNTRIAVTEDFQIISIFA